MDIDAIMNILEKYVDRHPLALEAGGEYVMQNDEAQEDALKAFCEIIDTLIP